MKKYDEIDNAIMVEMDASPVSFNQLHSRNVFILCAEYAKTENRNNTDWRILDRRLQALRKAGKITFTGKGWVKA